MDFYAWFSIRAWKRPARKTLAKICALFLCLTFVFPYLTWAFSPTNAPVVCPGVRFQQKTVSLPENLGTVTQAYQGGNRLVIFIQDLHCNYEAQKNIAGLIEHAAKHYGAEWVAVEGASLPISVRRLASVPFAWARQEIGDYLLRAGKITGPEWLAAQGTTRLGLEGIENAPLYASSLAKVRSFLNSESQGYVQDLREGLAAAKKSAFSAGRMALENPKRAFRDGKMTLLQYALFLRQAGQEQGLDLKAFPNVEQYLALNRERLGDRVDADGLFQELEALDQALRRLLAETRAEAELESVEHRLDILERALNISASPADLAELEKSPTAFSVHDLAATIRQHLSSEEWVLDPEAADLDGNLGQARSFYQLADERSRAFVENLCRRMDARQANMAVLVTGGFHTEKVLAGLKARQISYLCVKPKLTQQDVANPYFDLLRNRRTPLEKLLEKTQTILAVASNFPQGADSNQPIEVQAQPETVRLLDHTIALLEKVAALVQAGERNWGNTPQLQALAKNIRAAKETGVLIVDLQPGLSAVLRQPGVAWTPGEEDPRRVVPLTMKKWHVALVDAATLAGMQNSLLAKASPRLAFAELVLAGAELGSPLDLAGLKALPARRRAQPELRWLANRFLGSIALLAAGLFKRSAIQPEKNQETASGTISAQGRAFNVQAFEHLAILGVISLPAIMLLIAPVPTWPALVVGTVFILSLLVIPIATAQAVRQALAYRGKSWGPSRLIFRKAEDIRAIQSYLDNALGKISYFIFSEKAGYDGRLYVDPLAIEHLHGFYRVIVWLHEMMHAKLGLRVEFIAVPMTFCLPWGVISALLYAWSYWFNPASVFFFAGLFLHNLVLVPGSLYLLARKIGVTQNVGGHQSLDIFRWLPMTSSQVDDFLVAQARLATRQVVSRQEKTRQGLVEKKTEQTLYWREWLRGDEKSPAALLVPCPGRIEDILLIKASYRSGPLTAQQRDALQQALAATRKKALLVVVADNGSNAEILDRTGNAGSAAADYLALTEAQQQRRARLQEINQDIRLAMVKLPVSVSILDTQVRSTVYNLTRLKDLNQIYATSLQALDHDQVPPTVVASEPHGHVARVKKVANWMKAQGYQRLVFLGDYLGKYTEAVKPASQPEEYVAGFEVVDELRRLMAEDDLQINALMGRSELLFLRAMLGDPQSTEIWLNTMFEGRTVLRDLRALESQAITAATPELQVRDIQAAREFEDMFRKTVNPEGHELSAAELDAAWQHWFRFHPKLLDMAEFMVEHMHFVYYEDEAHTLYMVGGANPELDWHGLKGVGALVAMERDFKEAAKGGLRLTRLIQEIWTIMERTEKQAGQADVSQRIEKALALIDEERAINRRLGREIIPDFILVTTTRILLERSHTGLRATPEKMQAMFAEFFEALNKISSPLPDVFKLAFEEGAHAASPFAVNEPGDLEEKVSTRQAQRNRLGYNSLVNVSNFTRGEQELGQILVTDFHGVRRYLVDTLDQPRPRYEPLLSAHRRQEKTAQAVRRKYLRDIEGRATRPDETVFSLERVYRMKKSEVEKLLEDYQVLTPQRPDTWFGRNATALRYLLRAFWAERKQPLGQANSYFYLLTGWKLPGLIWAAGEGLGLVALVVWFQSWAGGTFMLLGMAVSWPAMLFTLGALAVFIAFKPGQIFWQGLGPTERRTRERILKNFQQRLLSLLPYALLAAISHSVYPVFFAAIAFLAIFRHLFYDLKQMWPAWRFGLWLVSVLSQAENRLISARNILLPPAMKATAGVWAMSYDSPSVAPSGLKVLPKAPTAKPAPPVSAQGPPLAEVVVKYLDQEGIKRTQIVSVSPESVAREQGRAWPPGARTAWVRNNLAEISARPDQAEWEKLRSASENTLREIFLDILSRDPRAAFRFQQRFAGALPDTIARWDEYHHDFGNIFSLFGWIELLDDNLPGVPELKAETNKLNRLWSTGNRIRDTERHTQEDPLDENLQVIWNKLTDFLEKDTQTGGNVLAALNQETFRTGLNRENMDQLGRVEMDTVFFKISEQLPQLVERYLQFHRTQQGYLGTRPKPVQESFSLLRATLLILKQCLSREESFSLSAPTSATDLRLLYLIASQRPGFVMAQELELKDRRLNKRFSASLRKLGKPEIKVVFKNPTSGFFQKEHWVRGEEGRLLIFLLKNLVTNAQRAMVRRLEPQENETWLQYKARREAYLSNAAVVVAFHENGFSVEDMGDGLSPEIAQSMFARGVTEGGGQGLGLYTVLKTAKNSQAHMHYFSEVGKGTVVQVTFNPLQGTPLLEAQKNPSGFAAIYAQDLAEKQKTERQTAEHQKNTESHAHSLSDFEHQGEALVEAGERRVRFRVRGKTWDFVRANQPNNISTNLARPEAPEKVMLFAYMLPVAPGFSDNQLYGVMLEPGFQDQGLLRPLLNLFFTEHPAVRSTNPAMENLLVLDFLTREYGFAAQNPGAQPNVWIKEVEPGSAAAREGKRVQVFFDSPARAAEFKKHAPQDMQALYLYTDRREKDFRPVCLGEALIVKDQAKFALALAQVPVKIAKSSATAASVLEGRLRASGFTEAHPRVYGIFTLWGAPLLEIIYALPFANVWLHRWLYKKGWAEAEAPPSLGSNRTALLLAAAAGLVALLVPAGALALALNLAILLFWADASARFFSQAHANRTQQQLARLQVLGFLFAGALFAPTVIYLGVAGATVAWLPFGKMILLGMGLNFSMHALNNALALAGRAPGLRRAFPRLASVLSRLEIAAVKRRGQGSGLKETPQTSLDSIINQIWENNTSGRDLHGIVLTEYPRQYGNYAVYYLIRDIKNNFNLPEEISPMTLPGRVQRLTSLQDFKIQHLTADRFFVLQATLAEIHAQGRLQEFSSLKNLTALMNLFGDQLAQRGMDTGKIHLGQVTRLISTPVKLREMLNLSKMDAQVLNWNMPIINLPWQEFSRVVEWLQIQNREGTLQQYGGETGNGLVSFVDQINAPGSRFQDLRGINIRQFTSLLNTAQNVAELLGTGATAANPQLRNWKMPVIDLTWEHYTALIKVMRQKYEAGTLAAYGSQDGSGLIKLLEEIRKGASPLDQLQQINIGQLTGLLNSPVKLAGILKLDPHDPVLAAWHMPEVDLTWEQYAAIRKILKDKYHEGVLAAYGDADGWGLTRLVLEISLVNEPAFKALRGINLGQLTRLINSPKKIAGMMGNGTTEQDPQLAHWQLPTVKVTWEIFLEQYLTVSERRELASGKLAGVSPEEFLPAPSGTGVKGNNGKKGKTAERGQLPVDAWAEARMLYPKALLHSPELAGHLDAFDRANYQFEIEERTGLGFWRSRHFPSLVLGTWEDVEQKDYFNHQLMRRHVVTRYAKPGGGTVSFYSFDDHACSVLYAQEAVARGEMPATGNVQIFLDEHEDNRDIAETHQPPAVADLDAWQNLHREGYLWMGNLNSYFAAANFIQKQFWVFDGQAVRVKKWRQENQVRENLKPLGNKVPVLGADFIGFFNMPQHPQKQSVFLNVDTDVVGDRLGVGDEPGPSRGTPAEAMSLLANFLTRLRLESAVEFSTFHASTTADMHFTYGDVELVRFLARVAPAILLSAPAAAPADVEALVAPAIAQQAGKVFTAETRDKLRLDSRTAFYWSLGLVMPLSIPAVAWVNAVWQGQAWHFSQAPALASLGSSTALLGAALLGWIARVLGRRAGPRSPIAFLGAALDNPDVPFFEVQNGFLKVNPQVKNALTWLPAPLQFVLLYGLGIAGHEALHLRGWRSEFLAYGLMQALPGLAGALVFGGLALLLVPFGWALAAGILGAGIFTGITGWLTARGLFSKTALAAEPSATSREPELPPGGQVLENQEPETSEPLRADESRLPASVPVPEEMQMQLEAAIADHYQTENSSDLLAGKAKVVSLLGCAGVVALGQGIGHLTSRYYSSLEDVTGVVAADRILLKILPVVPASEMVLISSVLPASRQNLAQLEAYLAQEHGVAPARIHAMRSQQWFGTNAEHLYLVTQAVHLPDGSLYLLYTTERLDRYFGAAEYRGRGQWRFHAPEDLAFAAAVLEKIRTTDQSQQKVQPELAPLRATPGQRWALPAYLEQFPGRPLPPFITGGNGFIGSHLTDQFIHHQESVADLVRDARQPGNLQTALQSPQAFIVESGDYFSAENRGRLETLVQRTPLFYHTAGQATTRIENPDMAVQTFVSNVFLTGLLAYWAQKHNRKMVYVSSADIYTLFPGHWQGTVNEETELPLSPRASQFVEAARREFGAFVREFAEGRTRQSPQEFVTRFLARQGILEFFAHPGQDVPVDLRYGLYSLSKIIPESFVLRLPPGQGVVLRITNAYGERQKENQVTAIFGGRVARGQSVFASDHVRDFLQVEDIARAIKAAGDKLLAGKIGRNQMFLIASGQTVSMSELLDQVIQASGKQGVTYEQRQDFPLQQAPRYDLTRARQVLGWEPQVDLATGLGSMQTEIQKKPATAIAIVPDRHNRPGLFKRWTLSLLGHWLSAETYDRQAVWFQLAWTWGLISLPAIYFHWFNDPLFKIILFGIGLDSLSRLRYGHRYANGVFRFFIWLKSGFLVVAGLIVLLIVQVPTPSSTHMQHEAETALRELKTEAQQNRDFATLEKLNKVKLVFRGDATAMDGFDTPGFGVYYPAHREVLIPTFSSFPKVPLYDAILAKGVYKYLIVRRGIVGTDGFRQDHRMEDNGLYFLYNNSLNKSKENKMLTTYRHDLDVIEFLHELVTRSFEVLGDFLYSDEESDLSFFRIRVNGIAYQPENSSYPILVSRPELRPLYTIPEIREVVLGKVKQGSAYSPRTFAEEFLLLPEDAQDLLNQMERQGQVKQTTLPDGTLAYLAPDIRPEQAGLQLAMEKEGSRLLGELFEKSVEFSRTQRADLFQPPLVQVTQTSRVNAILSCYNRRTRIITVLVPAPADFEKLEADQFKLLRSLIYGHFAKAGARSAVLDETSDFSDLTPVADPLLAYKQEKAPNPTAFDEVVEQALKRLEKSNPLFVYRKKYDWLILAGDRSYADVLNGIFYLDRKVTVDQAERALVELAEQSKRAEADPVFAAGTAHPLIQVVQETGVGNPAVTAGPARVKVQPQRSQGKGASKLEPITAFLTGLVLALPAAALIYAALTGRHMSVSGTTSLWFSLVPAVVMTSSAFLGWSTRALGRRAGPNPAGAFLNTALADSSVSFFEVQNGILKVNPQVKNALAWLPLWAQSLLLYGFGIVGHEAMHLRGHSSEWFAYGVMQALPAALGALVFGGLALLALPVAGALAVGFLGAGLTVGLAGWLAARGQWLPDVRTFAEYRQIAETQPDRAEHIRRVIGFGDAFLAHDFDYFLSRLGNLDPAARAKYVSLLQGLWDQLQALPGEDQQALRWALELHDLGYANGGVFEHEQRGAKIAEALLARHHIAPALRQKIAVIILGHTGIGDVVQGVIRPATFQANQGSTPLLFLQIHNAMDVAGVIGSTSANFLDLPKLEEFALYAQKAEEIKNHFDTYRLEKLAKPLRGAPDLTPAQLSTLHAMAQQVFGAHAPEIRQALRERLDTPDRTDLIGHQLVARDPSYRLFVKFMELLAWIALLQNDANVDVLTDLEGLIASRGKDEALSASAEKLIASLNTLPDSMDLETVRQYVERSGWITAFPGTNPARKQVQLNFRFLLSLRPTGSGLSPEAAASLDTIYAEGRKEIRNHILKLADSLEAKLQSTQVTGAYPLTSATFAGKKLYFLELGSRRRPIDPVMNLLAVMSPEGAVERIFLAEVEAVARTSKNVLADMANPEETITVFYELDPALVPEQAERLRILSQQVKDAFLANRETLERQVQWTRQLNPESAALRRWRVYLQPQRADLDRLLQTTQGTLLSRLLSLPEARTLRQDPSGLVTVQMNLLATQPGLAFYDPQDQTIYSLPKDLDNVYTHEFTHHIFKSWLAAEATIEALKKQKRAPEITPEQTEALAKLNKLRTHLAVHHLPMLETIGFRYFPEVSLPRWRQWLREGILRLGRPFVDLFMDYLDAPVNEATAYIITAFSQGQKSVNVPATARYFPLTQEDARLFIELGLLPRKFDASYLSRQAGPAAHMVDQIRKYLRDSSIAVSGADKKMLAPDRMPAVRQSQQALLGKRPLLDSNPPGEISPTTLEGTLERIFQQSGGRYRAQTTTRDGFTAYRFTDVQAGSVFEIVPGFANKITELTVGGKNILHLDNVTASGGIEVMYPFMDRLRGNSFTYAGKTVSLDDPALEARYTKKDATGTVYHGMARRLPWKVEEVGFDEQGIFIRSGLNNVDYPEILERFGAGRVTLTYRLAGNELRSQIHLQNSSIASTGSHPWIKRGDGDWYYRVPAATETVMQDMLPTGEHRSVAGTNLDLREFKAADRNRHAVLTNLTPNAEGKIVSEIYNALDGTFISVEQSTNLPFVVIWDKEPGFFAIEPVSSPPAALNDPENQQGLQPITSQDYTTEVTYRVEKRVDAQGVPLKAEAVFAQPESVRPKLNEPLLFQPAPIFRQFPGLLRAWMALLAVRAGIFSRQGGALGAERLQDPELRAWALESYPEMTAELKSLLKHPEQVQLGLLSRETNGWWNWIAGQVTGHAVAEPSGRITFYLPAYLYAALSPALGQAASGQEARAWARHLFLHMIHYQGTLAVQAQLRASGYSAKTFTQELNPAQTSQGYAVVSAVPAVSLAEYYQHEPESINVTAGQMVSLLLRHLPVSLTQGSHARLQSQLQPWLAKAPDIQTLLNAVETVPAAADPVLQTLQALLAQAGQTAGPAQNVVVNGVLSNLITLQNDPAAMPADAITLDKRVTRMQVMGLPGSQAQALRGLIQKALQVYANNPQAAGSIQCLQALDIALQAAQGKKVDTLTPLLVPAGQTPWQQVLAGALQQLPDHEASLVGNDFLQSVFALQQGVQAVELAPGVRVPQSRILELNTPAQNSGEVRAQAKTGQFGSAAVARLFLQRTRVPQLADRFPAWMTAALQAVAGSLPGAWAGLRQTLETWAMVLNPQAVWQHMLAGLPAPTRDSSLGRVLGTLDVNSQEPLAVAYRTLVAERTPGARAEFAKVLLRTIRQLQNERPALGAAELEQQNALDWMTFSEVFLGLGGIPVAELARVDTANSTVAGWPRALTARPLVIPVALIEAKRGRGALGYLTGRLEKGPFTVDTEIIRLFLRQGIQRFAGAA
jgi:nucleoside-diphosphate-sugar epimerase/galactose mutarotase-like enzyme/signal transduction histidine kinase